MLCTSVWICIPCVEAWSTRSDTNRSRQASDSFAANMIFETSLYDAEPRYRTSVKQMKHLTLMRMFSGFTSRWKIPQLWIKREYWTWTMTMFLMGSFDHFRIYISAFITTCACAQVTCRVGTCNSLLCDQAGVFFVLEVMKNWYQAQNSPRHLQIDGISVFTLWFHTLYQLIYIHLH